MNKGENNRVEMYTILSGENEVGMPIFSVLLKRTYDLLPGKDAVRSEKTNSFVMVDEYYDDGNPLWSTVKYETELIPYKIATDVVIIGKAYATYNIPTAQIDVSLEVSGYKKIIRVIGDRYCVYRNSELPDFTEPTEFIEMEIRYEKAYGGKDDISDPELNYYYPRNPVGTGFAVKNNAEIINRLKLPNLEDPEDLLTPERIVLEDPYLWNRQPFPQGFGWYQRNWYPRCSFVGSIPGFVKNDEVMREELIGLVPKNQIALSRQFKLPSFDIRFNNGGSPGLILPFLSGGEPIRLINMNKEGILEFNLPEDRPGMMLNIGHGEKELEPVMQTVCIRPEDMQIDLIWRGAIEYGGIDWLPQMKKLHAEIF